LLIGLTFKLRTNSRLTEICCQHLFRYRSSSWDVWTGSLASIFLHTSSSHIMISLIQFSWQRLRLQLTHHLNHQPTLFLHKHLSALNLLYIFQKNVLSSFRYIAEMAGEDEICLLSEKTMVLMSWSRLLNIATWEN
jgi:hypothetical protein